MAGQVVARVATIDDDERIADEPGEDHMGWEVHLTRAEDWAESDERPIAAEEWLAVVEGDPELRIDPANGPYFAVWSGPCSNPEGGWFDWTDGCITTKHPDRAILGKLLQLGEKLGAVVQGDDGEVYARPEDLPDDTSPPTVRPWWKFW